MPETWEVRDDGGGLVMSAELLAQLQAEAPVLPDEDAAAVALAAVKAEIAAASTVTKLRAATDKLVDYLAGAS